MILRTPARKALRNRRGGEGGGTGVGLGKAVAKASVGPPRGVMVVTRETFGREGVGGGGWLQDLVFTFIYTQLHMLSWWGFFCGFGGDGDENGLDDDEESFPLN